MLIKNISIICLLLMSSKLRCMDLVATVEAYVRPTAFVRKIVKAVYKGDKKRVRQKVKIICQQLKHRKETTAWNIIAYQHREILELLENHSPLLRRIKQQPNNQLLTYVIEPGYYGLATLLIQKGIIATKEDLALTKRKYLEAKKTTMPFKLEKLRTYKKIGLLIINQLRFFEAVGSNTYGPLSKYGVGAVLPPEVVSSIYSFIVK